VVVNSTAAAIDVLRTSLFRMTLAPVLSGFCLGAVFAAATALAIES
jgi:hypothetical protein